MYFKTINSFIRDIKALRTYVDSVEPIIQKTKKEKLKENITAAIFTNFIEYKLKEERKKEDIPEKLLELYKELDKFILIDNDNDNVENKIKIKTNLSLDKVNEEIRNLDCYSKQETILYRGSLVSLITYFEGLISKLFKTDFINHPSRMGLENKAVTYNQLLSLKSVDEVKHHLIEEEIVKMMYKDSDSWFNYFKTNLKIKLKYIDKVNDELIEIFARRNLFVHNDGKVNSFYLSKVSDKIKQTIKRGDRLEVNREYIDRAIELIEEVGIILAFEIWINEKGKDLKERQRMFNIITNEYLINERWNISLELYDVFLQNKKINKQEELLSKLNKWQCYKWTGRYSEIKDIIEKEDFSAYSLEFQLGILALKDNFDEFFRLYDSQNIISEQELKDWPIFRGIRETEEYKRRFDENNSIVIDVDECEEEV